jgi:hypothetical protein
VDSSLCETHEDPMNTEGIYHLSDKQANTTHII